MARSSQARASACRRSMRFTRTGAATMFCSTFICGKRLKLWNTMPIRSRALAISRSDMRAPAAVPVNAIADRLAVDCDRPTLVLLEQVDAAQQGGLARTARTDHHDDLAGADCERDVAQHLDRAEALVQADDVEHRALLPGRCNFNGRGGRVVQGVFHRGPGYSR